MRQQPNDMLQQQVPVLPLVNVNQEVVQKVQVWRCDVCHERTFPTFQEACDHEEQCKTSATAHLNAATTVPTVQLTRSSSLTPIVSSQETSEGLAGTVPHRAWKQHRDATVVQVAQQQQQSIVAAANKKKLKSHQSTISSLLGSCVADAQQLLSPHAIHESMKPVKRSLRRTAVPKEDVVDVDTQDTVVHILEVLSPQTEYPSAATVRTKRGRIVSSDVQPTMSTTKENSKRNKLTTTTNSATTTTTKTGTLQKALKKRSSKTSISASSSHTVTMKDWFRVPTIPEEQQQENDIVIVDVDSDYDGISDFAMENTKLMTEQTAAYQFREERRKKQQFEREKQLRRQQLRQTEQQQQESFQSTNMAYTTPVMMDIVQAKNDTTNIRRPNNQSATTTDIPLATAAIRFPTQSHIIPSTELKTSRIYSDGFNTTVVPGKQWWNQKVIHPVVHRPEVSMDLTSNIDSVATTISTTTTGRQDHLINSHDLLQTAIRSCIVPVTMDGSNNRRDRASLWVDRYYNNHMLLRNKDTDNNTTTNNGNSQAVVYEQIRTFIERFMIERQTIERATLEKQNRQRQNYFGVVPTNQKRKDGHSNRRTNDDDYLWNDDDCTNSNPAFDANRWSSLCVVSGPIGCGKSNMVHRVSKQLGCQKVVELHTGMKRNAASMKRIVEEATKSHSTFDMLQNLTKREVDNDESDDRGSAVTVILIDEVDNLYPNTDCGFWTALCELYKESKCPIVVTCNSIPNELYASAFHWTHIPIERPTASECAAQLHDILLREGYTVQGNHDSNETAKPTDALTTIAKLGNCDMRRILYELQSLHVDSIPTISQRRDYLEMIQSLVPPTIDSYEPFQFPIVESTHPTVIHFDRYTSLTITGSNFLSLIDPTPIKDKFHCCKVYIGDYCCSEARIVNDSTILAVVAPSQLPVAIMHLPVNVGCAKRLGILSSTRHCIAKLDLPDQTKLIATGQPCLVECRSGEIALHNDSDSENEFDDDVSREVAHAEMSERVSKHESLTTMKQDSEISMRIMNETIGSDLYKERYGALEGQATIATTSPKANKDELQQLYDLEAMTCLASDASMLEDDTLNHIPVLSGPCSGFGFTYTEEFPKRTNENSKPPTEEQLYVSQWKENANFYGTGDCYMTRCISYRERKLLQWSESSIRGCSPKYAGLLDEMVSDEFGENSIQSSDEDCFQSIAIQTPLLDLPQLLTPSPSHMTLSSTFRHDYHLRRKESVRTEAFQLLRKYIFTQPKYIRYSGRLGALCTQDAGRCLPDASMLNSDIFLDYLPMLRCMAVQEQILDFIFQSHEHLNQECTSSNRRRNTRQSKKLGRDQYFDKIIPSHAWQCSDQSSKDVRSQLAKMSLLYETEPSVRCGVNERS